MILTDLNPRGGIGASCHHLAIGSLNLVIDAGLNPTLLGNECLPALDALRGIHLDLILLTHCHLDHVGALPVLLREHPEAKVLLSQPSHLLAPRMLHNSCNIMGRLREDKGIPEYPLYSHREVERAKKSMIPLLYGKPTSYERNGTEITITLHAGGHVPGAAGFHIRWGAHTFYATGDCLFTPQRILPGGTFPPAPCDALLMETTRGATTRAPETDRASEINRLFETAFSTLEAGGSVLIPTFAFGRMQEVFALLHDAKRAGNLPKVPIHASGLGLDLADYFDEISRKLKAIDFRKSILKDLRVRPVPDDFHPGARNNGRRPTLYVLSSGMVMEHTPSYNAAACLLDNPANAICFVGYCAPDTPGGKIQQGNHGDPFLFGTLDHESPRYAQIHRFDLSSHADREELLEQATALQPKTIVLAHGDPPARAWFTENFPTHLPQSQVLDPAPLQPVPLLP